MSIEEWSDPNNPKIKYKIGTADWELKKNNILEIVYDMAFKLYRQVCPTVGAPLSIIAGGVNV